MADDINRQRVLNFLEGYYGGDTGAAVKCCAEDMLLMVYLPVELFPHLGPQRGHKAVADRGWAAVAARRLKRAR